ncbi:MAG: RuBisCO large subunit C-terminal-like domain-containing protein [Candidatus Heimdallarchaeaceae archaeon]
MIGKRIEKRKYYGGKNIILQAGGGIHGHPDGIMKGAMAMRQALDATLKK